MSGNSSPSQTEGLSSKWGTMLKSFATLSGETVLATFKFITGGVRAEDIESPASQEPSALDVVRPGSPEPPPHSVPPARPPIPVTFNRPHVVSAPFPLRSARVTSAPSSSTLSGPSRTPEEEILSTSQRLRKGSHSPDGISKKYQSRDHIFVKSHKAQVKADQAKDREEMSKELYGLKRSSGYLSSYEDFTSLLNYSAKLEGQRDSLSPSPSFPNLHARPSTLNGRRRHTLSEEVTPAFLARALLKAHETLNAPKPPKPFTPTFDQLRLSTRAKDAEIEARLRGSKPAPLPASLSPAEEAEVDKFCSQRKGPIAKCLREQVVYEDMARLRPAQWLNDEIINFYGQMILSRSEATVKPKGAGAKENAAPKIIKLKPGERSKPLNVHYFSTFFWAKLKGEGYEKARLAKWTKKFDLFSKDVVLIPINHNNAHWTAAAINFRKKRIESFDSMGMPRAGVYKALRAYLDHEHRNKKGKPFDFTGWEDYSLVDTPQQENGFDCGVFTCHFLEALSRGEEAFNFSQKDMKYLRRRMALEIGRVKLYEFSS